MRKSIKRAIQNVIHHGDTDIFPFPIENFVFSDCDKEVVDFIEKSMKDFDQFLIDSPPANYGTLAPVGYTGFRWATQIDPIWNAAFLAMVIELGDKIEDARIPTSENKVFSYRFNSGSTESDIFQRNIGWRQFNEHALIQAQKFSHVVSCDISEFYPRLNHHRLDNALRQLPNSDQCRYKIMEFLKSFSGTYSFGLPVGGPASRLLSELTLNQIDRLLQMRKIPFCRFADDFYLFANSQSDAFKSLVYLSQILQRNQGLQLQKSKTRIMTSAEFVSTNPLTEEDEETVTPNPKADARRQFFKLSLYYDPYSPNAEEHYENLRSEIRKFPILDILKGELGKTRVNIALSRRLLKALRFIDGNELDEAVRSLIENEELLYPVYYNVLAVARSEFARLSEPTKLSVVRYVTNLIANGHSAMSVDLNLQYAVRLIGESQSVESISTLVAIYEMTSSEVIRRDILLIMAKWRNWTWLSDRKTDFRKMSYPERRAFIIASYMLSDEGRHWRDHTNKEFTGLEIIVRDWMSQRVQLSGWELSL